MQGHNHTTEINAQIKTNNASRTAKAQADTTAADLAALKVDFNALLKKLRDAGLMAPNA